jgi:hypothetical protein
MCASIILAFAGWAFGVGSPHVDWRFDASLAPLLGSFLVLTLIGSLFAVPANLTIGSLWRSIARELKIKGWLAHCLAGATSALVVSAFVLRSSFALMNHLALWAIAIGLLSSLFAWLILRPDRDAPNPDTRAP